MAAAVETKGYLEITAKLGSGVQIVPNPFVEVKAKIEDPDAVSSNGKWTLSHGSHKVFELPIKSDKLIGNCGRDNKMSLFPLSQLNVSIRTTDQSQINNNIELKYSGKIQISNGDTMMSSFSVSMPPYRTITTLTDDPLTNDEMVIVSPETTDLQDISKPYIRPSICPSLPSPTGVDYEFDEKHANIIMENSYNLSLDFSSDKIQRLGDIKVVAKYGYFRFIPNEIGTNVIHNKAIAPPNCLGVMSCGQNPSFDTVIEGLPVYGQFRAIYGMNDEDDYLKYSDGSLDNKTFLIGYENADAELKYFANVRGDNYIKCLRKNSSTLEARITNVGAMFRPLTYTKLGVGFLVENENISPDVVIFGTDNAFRLYIDGYSVSSDNGLTWSDKILYDNGYVIPKGEFVSIECYTKVINDNLFGEVGGFTITDKNGVNPIGLSVINTTDATDTEDTEDVTTNSIYFGMEENTTTDDYFIFSPLYILGQDVADILNLEGGTEHLWKDIREVITVNMTPEQESNYD